MPVPGFLRPPGLAGVAEAPEEYGAYGKPVDPRYEFWACLALKHTPGIGPRTWKRLLEAHGSAWQAVSQVQTWEERRLATARVVQGFRDALWRPQAEEEWRQAAEGGRHVLLWSHPRYPQRLRQIADPPLFLYYVGDLTLLDSICVAVVGARKCSDYGRSMAVRLAGGLARCGVAVVSGMAYGIDRHAHLAALQEVGSSIAVLGAGLDSGYPAGNTDVRQQLEVRGLVLSELAPRAVPEPHQFPLRNRIVSGLSLAVVVAEASERSGGLITAARALEQNREVMAVPGQADWPSYVGCLRLINDGARAVATAEDVLRELAPHLTEQVAHAARVATAFVPASVSASAPASVSASSASGRPRVPSLPAPTTAPAPVPATAPVPGLALPPDLEDDERNVWEVLPEQGTRHIDDVCQLLGWEAGRVSRALVGLELAGAARQLPGMRYVRGDGS
ncbi:DNA-processing protein DprA [Megalodesulfovibrio gigas]|uniref:DNA-processing protein DprA n=1 Tax=Megalodesulfovibrio gigas TaxID=879 RepID=UPI00130E4024|nr:DNA-processing protein DprA [Megalodesulfovibrio gigas]